MKNNPLQWLFVVLALLFFIVFGAVGCSSPMCVAMFGRPSWHPEFNPLHASNPCLAKAMAFREADPENRGYVAYYIAGRKDLYHAAGYVLNYDGTRDYWDINDGYGCRLTPMEEKTILFDVGPDKILKGEKECSCKQQ